MSKNWKEYAVKRYSTSSSRHIAVAPPLEVNHLMAIKQDNFARHKLDKVGNIVRRHQCEILPSLLFHVTGALHDCRLESLLEESVQGCGVYWRSSTAHDVSRSRAEMLLETHLFQFHLVEGGLSGVAN